MPLVHRRVSPRHLSNKKLDLDRTDSEFIAVNNGTLVAVLKQLASLVTLAGEIFSDLGDLTGHVSGKIQDVRLRLEELEVKTELFDPKLIPVPEGTLDLNGNGDFGQFRLRQCEPLDCRLFLNDSRPPFLVKLYQEATKFPPKAPPRKPNPNEAAVEVACTSESSCEGHVVELRDEKQKKEAGVSKKFPGEVLVSVDVTGSIFDRMRANRRSLLVYTKRIRKKRRNTICGSLPNKECGVQTSMSSVTPATTFDTPNHRKYGGDSGHWSTSTPSRGGDDIQFPWEKNSNSSEFFFDDEDRTLTPQLENFTDGMVSDSDSVDTEGYFTSFRNECGFPKLKRTKSSDATENQSNGVEEDYELFGKGSTSTTASSCGTVVMRQKLELPSNPDSSQTDKNQMNDGDLEERVKRKSLIERIPSLVVVTPSPSCSSSSPPPKDKDFESGAGSESDDFQTNREEDELLEQLKRTSSYSSSTLSSISHGSTETLRDAHPIPTLPQPDVIADVYQVTLKPATTKLDSAREYCSLESPILLASSSRREEQRDFEVTESRDQVTPKTDSNSSAKIRGARVVLDASGEIIFSSETLRRKRRHKVSFDPGKAVKTVIYDALPRQGESVYDRLRKQSEGAEDLYDCIQEIRLHNLRQSEASALLYEQPTTTSVHNSSKVQNSETQNFETQYSQDARLLETDLDSAIPPVMPDLKTLPKIKDCLKRNESYRMATDEVKVVKNTANQLPSVPERMSTASEDPKWKGRDRDIPEEDPAFIQQVLNMSHQNKMSPSKFPVSPEDRPSFLRSRESPPTMEEISKQIYTFRKKFNIEPIALSRKLCSTQAPPQVPPRTGPTVAPLRETAFTTPLGKSKPQIPAENPKKTEIQTRSDSKLVKFEQIPAASVQRRLLFSSLREPSRSSSASTQKTVSFSSVAPQSQPTSSSKVSLRPKTSLSHFKRLLTATALKGSPGKSNSVSAMEVLRPRILGQETKL